MKGALLALALLSTTIRPDEKVGIIEFTVDSVSVNGGKTTVKATFINRGTLPTSPGHPDLAWRDASGAWRLTQTSDNGVNLIGKLLPNVPHKATFIYNRTGEKLIFYDGGFKGATRSKAVDLP